MTDVAVSTSSCGGARGEVPSTISWATAERRDRRRCRWGAGRGEGKERRGGEEIVRHVLLTSPASGNTIDGPCRLIDRLREDLHRPNGVKSYSHRHIVRGVVDCVVQR